MSKNRKTDIADLVMQKIEREDLHPIEKSSFLRRKILLWLMALVAVFVAGHSAGVLIYFAVDFDYELLPLFLKSKQKLSMLSTLLLWFVMLVFGSFFAVSKYRKTSRGYKTEPFALAAFLAIGTASLGFASYKSEIAHHLDEAFHKHLPYYESWEARKLMVWSQPEAGLLAGRIKRIESRDRFDLIDVQGNLWSVFSSKALFRGRVQGRAGEFIKIVGTKISAGTFEASEVRPWRGRRMRHRHHCQGSGAVEPDCARLRQ